MSVPIINGELVWIDEKEKKKCMVAIEEEGSVRIIYISLPPQEGLQIYEQDRALKKRDGVVLNLLPIQLHVEEE